MLAHSHPTLRAVLYGAAYLFATVSWVAIAFLALTEERRFDDSQSDDKEHGSEICWTC